MIATSMSSLRSNARQTYDLALAGAIGAVFGLYFYVELIDTRSVWVRDALAGVSIGGSIGYALNAVGPLRERAWIKFARVSAWGAVAGALGGAFGLVLGEIVLGTFQGGLLGRAISWSILGLGIGVSQGLAETGFRADRRWHWRVCGRVVVRGDPPVVRHSRLSGARHRYRDARRRFGSGRRCCGTGVAKSLGPGAQWSSRGPKLLTRTGDRGDRP